MVGRLLEGLKRFLLGFAIFFGMTALVIAGSALAGALLAIGLALAIVLSPILGAVSAYAILTGADCDDQPATNSWLGKRRYLV